MIGSESSFSVTGEKAERIECLQQVCKSDGGTVSSFFFSASVFPMKYETRIEGKRFEKGGEDVKHHLGEWQVKLR